MADAPRLLLVVGVRAARLAGSAQRDHPAGGIPVGYIEGIARDRARRRAQPFHRKVRARLDRLHVSAIGHRRWVKATAERVALPRRVQLAPGLAPPGPLGPPDRLGQRLAPRPAAEQGLIA